MSRKTVFFLLLIAGCSGAPRRTVDDADDDENEDSEAIIDAAVEEEDPPPPPRDAGQLDASRPPFMPERECKPGRYEGEFSCVISGLLPWMGKIGFDLVEEDMGSGEFWSLTIVPGTQIEGTDDSFDGMFSAELEGDFDCRTGALTGRLTNGKYLFGGFMEYRLEGPLQGTYQSDGGAPGFSGMLGKLTSADFEAFGELGPAATCTWSATQVKQQRDY